MLWLLFLPIRLAFLLVFGVVLIPFLLLRFVFKLAFGLVMLPIVAAAVIFGLLIGGIALSVGLLLPLLPLVLIALCLWGLFHLMRHPPVASAGRD